MGDSNNSFSVNPINAAFLNDRISQDVDMVTLRMNYRFGGASAPRCQPILIVRLRLSSNSKPRHGPGLFYF